MDGSGTARILAKFWFLTVAVLSVAVLYLAKVLFLPLAFAILFAFLLAPIVGLLERLRLPRAVAAVIVICGFAAIVVAAAWLLFAQLVSITNDLPTYRDNITEKIDALHWPSDSAIGRAQQEIQELSRELGLSNAAPSEPRQPANRNERKPLGSTPERPVQVREVARPTGRLDQLHGMAEPLTTALLTVVFTFFVILEREDLRNRLIRLSGEQNLTMTTHAMRDANARISRYFRLQLLVNLCFGGLVWMALYCIGLPHSIFFGALAALARFVPYVGSWTAALLPTLLSLAVFQGWTHSAAVFSTFAVLEVLTGNYIEPRIYGRNTGLTPLAILVSAAFWTLIWGPVGLMLSTPLTVCLAVLGRHVPSLEFLTVMLGDRPAIPPPTCFYQRLLARDEREAAEILDTCLKGDTLESIYDKVLIPALQLAVRDSQQDELPESTMAFVHQTMRELIEELGFREGRDRVNGGESGGHRAAGRGRVLCVPARDENDELAGMMLAQLLSSTSLEAVAIPASGFDDIMGTAISDKPDMVILSSMPPHAIARAHRIFRLLRARNPQLRILVGLWSYAEDMRTMAEKFSREEGVAVATSLPDAVTQVRSHFGLDDPEQMDAEQPATLASSGSA